MPTSVDVAARAVAVACSSASTFVHVLSFAPLVISPDDLFNRTFGQVGISDDLHIQVFQNELASQIRAALGGSALDSSVSNLTVNGGVAIDLVVNAVEALIDALP